MALFSTPDDEMITANEAAELLKVDVKSIRRYVDSGALIAYQVGPKNIRIRLSDLENLLRKINN